jgi:hypothetical protein
LVQSEKTAEARMRLMWWLFATNDAGNAEVWRGALKDADADVRQWAVRLSVEQGRSGKVCCLNWSAWPERMRRRWCVWRWPAPCRVSLNPRAGGLRLRFSSMRRIRRSQFATDALVWRGGCGPSRNPGQGA